MVWARWTPLRIRCTLLACRRGLSDGSFGFLAITIAPRTLAKPPRSVPAAPEVALDVARQTLRLEGGVKVPGGARWIGESVLPVPCGWPRCSSFLFPSRATTPESTNARAIP
jgi:hypothetical protein